MNYRWSIASQHESKAAQLSRELEVSGLLAQCLINRGLSDPDEAKNLAGDPAFAEIQAKMHRPLLTICNPEEVDQRAKRDQDALIASFGGREAAYKLGPRGATPIPN